MNLCRLHFHMFSRKTVARDRTFVSPVTISSWKSGACLQSLFWLLVFVTAGCRNANEVVELSGEVTLDDKRLKDGVIAFYPEGSDPSSASLACVEARIVEGAYRVSVPRGAQVVSIEASVPNARGRALPDDYPGARSAAAKSQIVPAKYNLNSELRYTADESNSSVDFRLTAH
jgi:hypothetical protein